MEQKIFYKGFDKDLCCRGMQYEIGKEYSTGAAGITAADLCSGKVLHFGRTLSNVDYYYSVPTTNEQNRNRFCEIECLGTLVEDGYVCGSTSIRIIRELSWEEITVLAGLDKNNAGKFNAGKFNDGDFNTGDYNSGDYNTGDSNSGTCNSGNSNSGSCNSGNSNAGYFNSCNGSTGVFCTEEAEIRLFNMPTDMTLIEFRDTKWYKALVSAYFPLTEWVDGCLKRRPYKEACAIWWDSLTDENKDIIQTMPNFNKDTFFQITGIKL